MEQVFSTRLKSLRTQKKLTQREAAEGIGISPATLSAYETEVKFPPSEILAKISSYYDVTMDWLWGLSGESGQPSLVSFADIFWALIQIEDALHGRLRINMLNESEISFVDAEIDAFLSDWDEIRSLYRKGTIRESLYSIWCKDRVEEAKNLGVPLTDDEIEARQRGLSDDDELPF